MSSCKCKNCMKTPKIPKIPVEKLILSGSSWLTHPTSSTRTRQLASPRSLKSSLLCIRLIMAALVMVHQVLPQASQTPVLGLWDNLHREKPQNLQIPGRREKKQRMNQDAFMLKQTEIQTYMCLVFLQTLQKMNLYTLCPNSGLL